jgi:hypothetical protein
MFNPNAGTFWIEAGAMQGGSRNQLEMPDDLARFFGDQARTDEIVSIQLAPGVQHIRPFVYRGDDYGHYTERWRLCLPTAQMGGPDYPNRVVRFDRLQLGGVTVFQLTVADRDSAEHNDWRTHSVSSNGGTGTTFGGREYGWWT